MGDGATMDMRSSRHTLVPGEIFSALSTSVVEYMDLIDSATSVTERLHSISRSSAGEGRTGESRKRNCFDDTALGRNEYLSQLSNGVCAMEDPRESAAMLGARYDIRWPTSVL